MANTYGNNEINWYSEKLILNDGLTNSSSQYNGVFYIFREWNLSSEIKELN